MAAAGVLAQSRGMLRGASRGRDRFVAAIAIGSSLVVSLLPVVAQTPAPVIPLVEARSLITQRRFVAAARALERHVAANPQTGEAWVLLAEACWADDRPDPYSVDRAVEALMRAVELDAGMATPWGRTALERLAVAAVRSERLAVARRSYQQLLGRETRPDVRARYETQLLEIALDEGNYVAPPATLYGPTGEVIGPVGPLMMRTNRWFEKGRHTQDPKKAATYYERAAAADPLMWQAPLNLGIARVRLRDFPAALEPLAEADRRWRAATPEAAPHLRAHLWRLIAFLELGRLDDAAVEVDVLTTLPFDPWVQLYVLRFLTARGRAAAAVAPLRDLRAAHPENVEVLYALALAERATASHRAADALLKDALDLIPAGHVSLAPWRSVLSAAIGGR